MTLLFVQRAKKPLTKGQSPPQENHIGPHSMLYLFVLYIIRGCENKPANKKIKGLNNDHETISWF